MAWHTRAMDEEDEKPIQRAAWFRYADASSIGIEIAAAISICAFAGRYLERNVTHWSPWTTLIAIAIGLGAAGRAIARTARNYKRQLAEQAAAESPESTSHDP